MTNQERDEWLTYLLKEEQDNRTDGSTCTKCDSLLVITDEYPGSIYQPPETNYICPKCGLDFTRLG